MAWQENLFQNLLTLSILSGLAITIYCKVTKKSLTELIIQVREAMAAPIDE